MQKILQELIDHVTLERIETCLFRGESRDIGTPQVFGGQVLAQALSAALRTVEERPVHSLHAYFLRAGDFNHPIVYEVDRARDGRSFSMRRVVAIQHGRQIFNLSASFQKHEEGPQHQFEMPNVPPPEDLLDSRELARQLEQKVPQPDRWFSSRERPFEFRFAQQAQMLDDKLRSPATQLWFKTVDRLPDDDVLHRTLLAYVSDYHLIRTSTLPHNLPSKDKKYLIASLDHAMWFHRNPRVDDWLLYALDSPNMSGSRGLARGMIYNRKGELLATIAQEGMVRLINRN